MANKNNRCRQASFSRQTQSNPTSTYTEPTMRRWSHPITTSSPQEEPTLHYIYCALSYQNQLLADMKALLEQLVADIPTSHVTSNGATISYEKK